MIRLDQLSRNLDEKADWMMENIRRREWVKDGENGWFNGYYDDHNVLWKGQKTARYV